MSFAHPPPPPPPAPAPSPAARPPTDRAKVAVLPPDDNRLFRAERAELRHLLANRLATLDTDHTILPLADVDAKLRPISATTGARCAFEAEPPQRRAQKQGWLSTDMLHVAGLKGQREELWVQIVGAFNAEQATFTAPWDPTLDLADRYRTSFAALARNDDVDVFGGLGASGSEQGALREGSITLCETKPFGACDEGSAAWKDKAGEIAACFAGEDEGRTEVLIQGDSTPARCELAGLDALDGREGKREACLCRALTASSAMRAKAGRRAVRVRFEATDLAGKPRPELRVVESSTNLGTETDWHSIKTEREGKTEQHTVQRLVVDHLDGLAAPLTRCAVPAGSVLVADIDVREDGAVSGARIVTGLARKDAATCVEKVLGRGAFTCTDDGKPAKLRIALTWPDAAKRPTTAPRSK